VGHTGAHRQGFWEIDNGIRLENSERRNGGRCDGYIGVTHGHIR
jgi:hypothetical protein